MANWDFTKLPKRLHKKVINEFNSGNYAYLKLVYVAHQVVGCASCVSNHSAIRDWTTWAINKNIISDDQPDQQDKVFS